MPDEKLPLLIKVQTWHVGHRVGTPILWHGRESAVVMTFFLKIVNPIGSRFYDDSLSDLPTLYHI